MTPCLWFIVDLRPLHYGSWQGHDALVELLLLHHADVNQPAADGNTPLHLAAEHGHFCVVRRLVSLVLHLMSSSHRRRDATGQNSRVGGRTV